MKYLIVADMQADMLTGITSTPFIGHFVREVRE